MQGVRLPDQQTPRNPGEYAFMDYSVREVHHPDEIGDGEWWVCDPNGAFYRLVEPTHNFTVDENGNLTVRPSIVAPTRGYHGFLINGVWS
jgi:hypothetical protein